jgi:hypothetical protein
VTTRDDGDEFLPEMPLRGDQKRAVHVERGDVRGEERREVRGERQGKRSAAQGTGASHDGDAKSNAPPKRSARNHRTESLD